LGNAALGLSNYIDLTTTVLTANAALATAPVTYLQNPHVGKKWRDNAVATFVSADLASARSIDAVMLAGVSGTNPAFIVKLGTTSGASDVFTSGSVSGLPYYDPDYQLFVYLLTAPLSARFVRVDISEAAVPYIEAGRWFVGLRNTFITNYQPTWTRNVVRNSQDVIGVGGQTYVDLRAGYTRQQAQFDFAEETEREGFIDDIFTAIKNQGHKDMLWVMNPDSTNLSRDCIWGYIDGDLSTAQSLVTVPAFFSVSFAMRQRL
jgi:hypothetical protein